MFYSSDYSAASVESVLTTLLICKIRLYLSAPYAQVANLQLTAAQCHILHSPMPLAGGLTNSPTNLAALVNDSVESRARA